VSWPVTLEFASVWPPERPARRRGAGDAAVEKDLRALHIGGVIRR
jgi:hypothetical protein